MNFFGHAAIAGRFRAEPAFVLGAMLPDFCGMLGLRVPRAGETTLGAGIEFHHVTDHAFHELDVFRASVREATALLDARGVRRGTARAVAHVGVELFVDAELAEEEAARARYFEALNAGRAREVFEDGTFSPEDTERLAGLARTLEERGVAKRPDTAVVVLRLERALASRSRLAIEPRDQRAVSEWVELFRGRVVASTPQLVSELTSAIERSLAA
jgi:hypothetical protein